MDRKLRMGMVGGGPGAFIGEVHRKAARMDGGIELVAGAFDIDPKKSRQMGRELCIDKKRVYNDYQTMLEKETALPEDERIDFVSVCTPNHTHFPIAKAFLEAGFNVMCEKPMTLTVKEAEELKVVVQKTRKVFGLMHTYTAYPMVKLARDMVRQGDLGKIRKVIVQYPQGWLARAIEKEGQQQASWRTDPKKSGAAGCMGDIGTHAHNLVRFITGLEVSEVAAEIGAVVPGRLADDYGGAMLRFENGARGIFWVTQTAAGVENCLRVRVSGTKGSVEWMQEQPTALSFKPLDGPAQIRTPNGPGTLPLSARASRIVAGHPEGFHEGFATIYSDVAEAIAARRAGVTVDPMALKFPNAEDGLIGVKFVEAAMASSGNGGAWTSCVLPETRRGN